MNSPNPLQGAWDSMLALSPFKDDENDVYLFTAFLLLCHHIVFYGCLIGTAIISHFNLFAKYKVQQDKYPSPSLVKRAVIETLIIHFGVYMITSPLIITKLFYKFNTTNMHAPLPSIPRLLAELLVCFAVCDTQFYWGHRLFHSVPFLYKHFHKKHHEFKVNTSIAAEYTGAPEQVLLNIPSALLGPLLFASHPITSGIFVALRMLESLEIHSGYHFPWAPFGFFSFLHGGARFHEFHHSKNVGNFGVFRLWDRFMGTDVAYNRVTEELRQKQEEKAKAH